MTVHQVLMNVLLDLLETVLMAKRMNERDIGGVQRYFRC